MLAPRRLGSNLPPLEDSPGSRQGLELLVAFSKTVFFSSIFSPLETQILKHVGRVVFLVGWHYFQVRCFFLVSIRIHWATHDASSKASPAPLVVGHPFITFHKSLELEPLKFYSNMTTIAYIVDSICMYLLVSPISSNLRSNMKSRSS